jgi:hypothetical protein
MHPKIASARLAVSKFEGCMGLGLHTLVYTLDGQEDVLVTSTAALATAPLTGRSSYVGTLEEVL